MRSLVLLVLLGLLQATVGMPKEAYIRRIQDEMRDVTMHRSYSRKSRESYKYEKVFRAPTAETESHYWADQAAKSLESQLKKRFNENVAKNVIFYLGDGMSVPTLMAARAYQGQLDGKSGEEGQLFWEKFPFSGFSKTYCLDKQVADSACTSTAYMTGVKTNYGTLGINGHVKRHDCTTQLNTTNHVDSILQWAINNGKSAGIVTTTRITHASPAGGYSHVANRDWESDKDLIKDGAELCKDIAKQLVTQEPGRSLSVVMGGGRRAFLGRKQVDDEGTRGNRRDGRNLIDEWMKGKTARGQRAAYSWNRKSVQDIIAHPEKYDNVLGLYEDTHMQYHLEASPETEPTLEEMAEAAIKVLSKNNNGFVLFVEGGRIDHAHHAAFAKLALDETVELAKAVKKGRELTSSEDTLIIVTADHAHTMSIAGYATRGNSIVGKSTDLGDDKLGYMTLSYANGPGYRSGKDGSRHDIDGDDTDNVRYEYPGLVPLGDETHGGDDVAIFADGPWSHLFTGTIEQSNIPHFLAYASCLKPNSVCNAKR